MKNFAKVVIFSLAVMGFFVLFAVKYIPPITPAPPPEVEVLDLGAMTMDDFKALGDKIFNGKGTCTLCHNPVVKRAPLLEQIAASVKDRLEDPRYKGKATNSEQYIIESMVEPSIYVVAGFGVTGSNDTVSPMPVISAGAIGLTDAEIKAVTAYLQDLGGEEVTVQIPAGEPAAKEEPAVAAAAAPTPPASTASEALTKYTCNVCHKVVADAPNPGIGPDLTKTGAARGAEYIRKSVIAPNAEIAKGFAPMMPPTFKDQMTAGELELIVEYLMGFK